MIKVHIVIGHQPKKKKKRFLKLLRTKGQWIKLINEPLMPH
jgi:hypothetical protein